VAEILSQYADTKNKGKKEPETNNPNMVMCNHHTPRQGKTPHLSSLLKFTVCMDVALSNLHTSQWYTAHKPVTTKHAIVNYF
jgi:hypothetical protein